MKQMEIGNQPKTRAISTAVPAPHILGKRKLYPSVLRPDQISEDDKARMYLLMRKYYANTTEEMFLRDLREKDHVIVLRDLSEEIRGISTLLLKEVKLGKKLVRTVFSGDTVVDREFWGSKELGVAFLKYLFMQKIKSPFQPLYWMLMSKGYKTYLIMANNFRVHYPRYEKETPAAVQNLMNSFYQEKYRAAYNSEKGLIDLQDIAGQLREGVAPVTKELREKVPRIDFFAERNPNWEKGVELACIAEMSLYMPVYYFFKKTIGRIFKM
jgi:hypothetical protein